MYRSQFLWLGAKLLISLAQPWPLRGRKTNVQINDLTKAPQPDMVSLPNLLVVSEVLVGNVYFCALQSPEKQAFCYHIHCFVYTVLSHTFFLTFPQICQPCFDLWSLTQAGLSSGSLNQSSFRTHTNFHLLWTLWKMSPPTLYNSTPQPLALLFSL